MLELKGYVETPAGLVDLMVNKLFRYSSPSPRSLILVPGCGKGTFIEGIVRWCNKYNCSIPRVTGVELDIDRALKAMSKFARYPSISIENKDFLSESNAFGKYDFVIGNPPYVPISQLNEEDKKKYRKLYQSAQGRFDLYLLFFERSLHCLKNNGRLVFVTPEKFMYIQSAERLRRVLSQKLIEEISLLPEGTFGDLVTYPAVTTIVNKLPQTMFTVISPSGKTVDATLTSDGSPWLPNDNATKSASSSTLADVCERISCGVATGADSVFVKPNDHLDAALKSFAYPTIAGRELVLNNPTIASTCSMIIPYYPDGKLIALDNLKSLTPYLSQPKNRKKLTSRFCATYKPWYAFHETPPLQAILKPKILCKDITKQPYFWVDKGGTIVPRHSVYYIVPKDPARLDEIADYLNSSEAKSWLVNHCQHAANSFMRLQSHILKKLPLSKQLAGYFNEKYNPRVVDN